MLINARGMAIGLDQVLSISDAQGIQIDSNLDAL